VEIGNTTDHLGLEIVGYQFATAKDVWDANWLRVHVRASVDGRGWDSIDPCLLTSEVSEIAVWLECLADGVDVAPLEFLEPELAFELVGRDGDLIRLRVWFDGGLRPSWGTLRRDAVARPYGRRGGDPRRADPSRRRPERTTPAVPRSAGRRVTVKRPRCVAGVERGCRRVRHAQRSKARTGARAFFFRRDDRVLRPSHKNASHRAEAQ
jgi:hypothetical protein